MAENNILKEVPSIISENVVYEKQIEGIKVISIIPKKLEDSAKNFDEFITALNKAIQQKFKGDML